jgi:hypothetical protein
MKIVVMPPYDTMAVGIVLHYYQEAEVNPKGSCEDYAEHARKFLQTTQLSPEELTSIDTRLIFKEGSSSVGSEWFKGKGELVVGFDNFCSSIYDAVTGQQPMKKLEPVRRSDIPTLKSFDYNWKGDGIMVPTKPW